LQPLPSDFPFHGGTSREIPNSSDSSGSALLLNSDDMALEISSLDLCRVKIENFRLAELIMSWIINCAREAASLSATSEKNWNPRNSVQRNR
jgi:hypothetical protein